MSFGISGIGAYNPYMNGLGSYGLGLGSSFGSYGDPMMNSMMGMNGMMGLGMPMMGMYNPAFMRQMTQATQDMEKMQLEHTGAMHNLLKQNQLDAYRKDDQYLFGKSMVDSYETQIVNLAKAIRSGDADSVCEEFDKLKIDLYSKYRNELEANRQKEDPKDAVIHRIEEMYASIMSKKLNEPVSLRSDLTTFGETAFNHGFNKAFFGKKDYHDKYTEETISYLFGTRIDNKRGKDRMEKIGAGLGKAAEGATAAAGGFGIGVGLATLGATFSSSIRKALGTDFVRDEAGEIITEGGKKLTACTFGNGLKRAAKFGKWVAGAALLADAVWQFTRD